MEVVEGDTVGPTSPPAKWSVDDVANWVEGVVGAKWAAIFRREEVSGSAIAMFKDIAALEALVPLYGPRFALVQAFKKLLHGTVPLDHATGPLFYFILFYFCGVMGTSTVWPSPPLALPNLFYFIYFFAILILSFSKSKMELQPWAKSGRGTMSEPSTSLR
jgi:hypothetical protein